MWLCSGEPVRGRSAGMASADEQLVTEVERADWWCRHYARERGLSLDAFAVYSGVGRSSITQMKNRAPSLRTLSSIAAFLGVQVRDLLQDIPED